MERFTRRVARGVKRALGREVSSDSDSDDELGIGPYNPDHDDEFIQRLQQPQRARSPTAAQTAHMEERRVLKARRTHAIEEQAQAAQEQASLQRQAADFTHNFEIDEMIRRINLALGINVDLNDPRIRFIIGQIVNARGLTEESLRLMRRNVILLSAIRSIASRAGRGGRGVVVSAGQVVSNAGREALVAAGRLVSRGASAVASRLPSASALFFYRQNPPVLQGMPPLAIGSQAMPSLAVSRQQQAAVSRQQQAAVSRQQQVAADELLAQHLSSNLDAQRAAFAGFESAQNAFSVPASAPAPPPAPASAPPPAPASNEEEENICAICMAGPGIDEYGVNRGQLGYVVRHSSGTPGHPNKFHNSCLQECLRLDPRCPICRTNGPQWGMDPPSGQGGGSRKTRSKSKSKSKSRRYISKPRKSRKAGKRIRHYSSRRK